MATNKDYYSILGISNSASSDEIKQAYKKLAKEHHPDMVKDGDKSAAEQRFKEINEAYQVLSDQQKRKMYDQFGHVDPNLGGGGSGQGGQWGPFTYSYTNGGQGFSGFEDIDPFDVFENFFGFRGFGGSRSANKGKNLYYELHIDFADAVHGIEKAIKIDSGEVVIKIPAGAFDGMEMRFAGKGMPGHNNMPSGDLYITVRVVVPRQFQRVGGHLVTIIELDCIDAILGTQVDVPVVDLNSKSGLGVAKLKIPAGIQYGTKLRLSAKGMPDVRSKTPGDVIVQVITKVPQKLTKKQKEALESYKKVK